jgi:hypothetical protein
MDGTGDHHIKPSKPDSKKDKDLTFSLLCERQIQKINILHKYKHEARH